MFKCLNDKKGVSLYLVLIILAVILAIGLGLSAISVGQIRIIRGMGNSVIAFYAADTGIERVLMNRQGPSNISETPLPNGAKYQVIVMQGGTGDCTALNYCIKSIGSYKETKRAIEITY